MASHAKPLPPLNRSRKPAKAQRPASVALNREAKHRPEGEPVPAAKAKAHFLQLLDDVDRKRDTITITKRGRIVAQLVPAPQDKKKSAFDEVFGSMKGSATILGDIVSPDWESWGPEWR